MERIKQALDKAKSENAATVVHGYRGTRDQTGGKQSSELNVEYSQTRICTLDAIKLRENRLIVDDSDRTALSAYKMLRTQVLQRMTAKGWNALAVTSPAPQDGKTITAINLAISLARELHHTVLLVDVDLRNPSIHRYFDIEVSAGIGDYLLRGMPINEVLINPGIDRLVLLPGRKSIENSSELLAAPVMGRLVQELKTRYPTRLVIFDLPPVLVADDALSFAPFADAFLLVLRDGKTTRTEVGQVMEILRDVPIVGTVLNSSNDKVSAYY